MRPGLLLVLALTACGHPAATSAPAPAAPPSPPPQPRTCEALGVDWCNHAFGDEIGRPGIELVGGDWEEHVYACEDTPWAGEHVTFLYMVRDVVTGDLDGDGTDDALVAVDDIYDGCGDQGSYRTTRLLVYAVRDGAATRVLGTGIVRRATDAPITIAGRGLVRTHPGGCVERWELVGPGLAQIGAPCR